MKALQWLAGLLGFGDKEKPKAGGGASAKSKAAGRALRGGKPAGGRKPPGKDAPIEEILAFYRSNGSGREEGPDNGPELSEKEVLDYLDALDSLRDKHKELF